MENSNYVIERYVENAEGAYKKDKTIVVSMTRDQVRSIEGFLHSLCDNIEVKGRPVRYTIGRAGEADDMFMWSSK